MWTRKTQLFVEGLVLPSPPASPAVSPLSFGPVGMAAAPNISQECPHLRSSLSSVPPALNPKLGESQTKVAEAPPNPPLLSALRGRQEAWEMRLQVSQLLAPWAWRAAKRRSPEPGAGEGLVP